MESHLTESQEDYLEKIYEIITEKKGVKVKDIAERMKVKNSSVTGALKSLEESGYINYEPYGVISLTDKGEILSKNINQRHQTLKYFLVNILKIDEQSANETACRMEHIMSKETYKRFVQFTRYMQLDEEKKKWIEAFHSFALKDEIDVECNICVDNYIIKGK